MSHRQQVRTTPQINQNYWSFAITGKVSQPVIVSFEDLHQFPADTVRCALTCTGKHASRPMMREAEWHGVRLQTLLTHTEIDSTARYAHAYAADGYSTVLPLDVLVGAMLAYEMDSAPLTPEDGFPARLIVPGRHGYKMPKWINRIELSETAEGGFWESRGWSLEGEADTRVAILSHTFAPDGSVELAGVAFGGEKAIVSVQISIDGGSGMLIPFTPAERLSLTHWRTNWMPPGTGDYEVRVRVYAAGRLAPAEHVVVVKVR